MKKPKFKEEMLKEDDYKKVVERAREIAEKTKHLINKDTLIIYLDVSGRLARVPLEQAWKELGVKIPKKRFFFNFSVYKGEGRMSKQQKEALKRIIEKNKQAKNVLIIDTVSYRGVSLGLTKKELEKITNKKVSTVSMLDVEGVVRKPFGKPDYAHSKPFDVKKGDVMAVLDYQDIHVSSKEGKTVRHEEGLKTYDSIVKKVKKAFRRRRR